MERKIAKEELEGKVREWFQSSGKMKEIQAKIRAELFETIQSQIKTKKDLNLKASPNPKPAPPLTKIVNWLISEHLAQSKNWLTNSVFVTEAEIEENISPPGLLITSQVGSQLKQYETEVVSAGTIAHIIASLGFKDHPQLVKTVLENHHRKSQSVLCSLIKGLTLQEEKGGISEDIYSSEQVSVRKLKEKSIPAHLQSIDMKYQHILQDFNTRRRDDLKPTAASCVTCHNEEQKCGREFKVKAEERNRARNRKKKVRLEESVSDQTLDDSERNINELDKIERSSVNNRREMEDESYRKLYAKIDEFLLVQEKDKSMVMNLDLSLKKAESEILLLKHQLQEKEARSVKHEEEEKLKKLALTVKQQNEKIDEQNHEMLKLKNTIEINKLREKTNTVSITKQDRNENLTENCKDAKLNDSHSQTVDFLTSMKTKLDGLGKQDAAINDDFEDFNTQSGSNE